MGESIDDHMVDCLGYPSVCADRPAECSTMVYSHTDYNGERWFYDATPDGSQFGTEESGWYSPLCADGC